MNDISAVVATSPLGISLLDQKLKKSPGKIGMILFGIVLTTGTLWAGSQLLGDLLSSGNTASIGAYVLLGIALLIALGFEFVNGFHDTANAVATVIYTHSLEPHIAVVWSAILFSIRVLVMDSSINLNTKGRLRQS